MLTQSVPPVWRYSVSPLLEPILEYKGACGGVRASQAGAGAQSGLLSTGAQPIDAGESDEIYRVLSFVSILSYFPCSECEVSQLRWD